MGPIGNGGMMNNMASMASMASMGAKMGAGFGNYSRYPTLPGYVLAAGGGGGGSGGGGSSSGATSGNYSNYAEAVQTDTPPQTPPNLKVNSSVATPSGRLSHPYASPASVHHRVAPAPAENEAPVATPGVVDAAATAFRPIYRT